MSDRRGRIVGAVALLMLVVNLGFAGSGISVNTALNSNCASNTCRTDVGGWDQFIGWLSSFSNPIYSLIPGQCQPGSACYQPTPLVESQILTHNSVFTLDTTDTLVNGVVTGSTAT